MYVCISIRSNKKTDYFLEMSVRRQCLKCLKCPFKHLGFWRLADNGRFVYGFSICKLENTKVKIQQQHQQQEREREKKTIKGRSIDRSNERAAQAHATLSKIVNWDGCAHDSESVRCVYVQLWYSMAIIKTSREQPSILPNSKSRTISKHDRTIFEFQCTISNFRWVVHSIDRWEWLSVHLFEKSSRAIFNRREER